MRIYLRPKEEKTSKSQQTCNRSKIFQEGFNSTKDICGKNYSQSQCQQKGGFHVSGIRIPLTVLCKSTQGDDASISVDHVTSDRTCNALQNGANGGSV